MTDKNLVDKELSGETDLDLVVTDGKIQFSLKYDGKGADGAVSLSLDGDYFLDKLAEAIPGEIDDMILSAIKGALR